MAAELQSVKLEPHSQLLLDQPLLKVPHELARKNLKTAQRNIEREQTHLISSLKNAATAVTNTGDATAAAASLDNILSRLEALKRKLSALHDDEQELHRQSQMRIQHLNSLSDIPTLADVKFDEWSKVRLNRMLTDYLLRCGYSNSARQLAQATGTVDLVDIEAFSQCQKIEQSLTHKRMQEALSWCADNRSSLKKIGSELEHELRLQQYIELLRLGTREKQLEATNHAQKYLTSHTDPNFGIRAAGLLAFPPNTIIEPYKTLYSQQRWTYLISLFIKTHHTLLSLPTRPALYTALSAGLSALKTPACHSTHLSSSSNANTASGTSVCPICSTELNELARHVPYAHHDKSHVESDPVVLPNGRVYGRERLMAFQEKIVRGMEVGEGKVRDPTEPDCVFDMNEIRKVYVS